METKTLTVTYSNGESDELVLNDQLSDSLLEEVLLKMDLRVMDDIYGDVKPNENIKGDEGKR